MIRNKPYVIAECGVNWENSGRVAATMIEKAREEGADAVKFQCFDESVVDDEDLLKYSLTLADVICIKRYAERCHLEFLCTPMYPEAVEMLAPHVDRWKIRCGDLFWDYGLKIYSGGKTIINSSNPKERKIGIDKGENAYELYCIPQYPTSRKAIDFEKMKYYDGFSCHCPDMEIWPKVAETDPEIVEIHVTPNKDGSHPDDPVSYEFEQFGEIVDILKE